MLCIIFQSVKIKVLHDLLTYLKEKIQLTKGKQQQNLLLMVTVSSSKLVIEMPSALYSQNKLKQTWNELRLQAKLEGGDGYIQTIRKLVLNRSTFNELKNLSSSP